MNRTSAPPPTRRIWLPSARWEASPSPGSPTTRKLQSPARPEGRTSNDSVWPAGVVARTARTISTRHVSVRCSAHEL